MDTENSAKPKHKLIGKWIVNEAANIKDYPWAIGLPLDAEFEITEGLQFSPGSKCTGAFKDSKQMGKPSKSPLMAVSHSTNNADSLKMRVESVGEIDFVWYKKGNATRVAIRGPKIAKSSAAPAGGHLGVGIASLIFNHGGPHGIAN